MEWDQRSPWADDKVTVEIRFSMYHGWEWIMRHCDHPGGWATLDSGTCKTFHAALCAGSDALEQLAQYPDGF